MTDDPATGQPSLFIIAETPSALVELCGISMIERLLRTLQRIGFRRAIVLVRSPEVSAHLAKRSWARADLALEIAEQPNELLAGELLRLFGGATRALVVNGGVFYDARLVRALAEAAETTLLVDSESPSDVSGAACVHAVWLRGFGEQTPVAVALAEGRGVAQLDAAREPRYIVSMRRAVRPCFFPGSFPQDAKTSTRGAVAPPSSAAQAERLIFASAQNGTLDIPALVHGPIENAIVERICRTRITPNQVTLVTMLLGLLVTILFASGRFGWGVCVALAIGVLDGVDGKLARVKVETTPLGSWEHSLDYAIEFSWWSALAFQLHRTGKLPEAYAFLAVLVMTDFLGRVAKRRVKQRLGLNLDDVSEFDRRVRYVAGRRNIYVWMFAVGLIVAKPADAFVALCCWGAVSAAIHATRSMLLCRGTTRPPRAQVPQVG